MRWLLASAVVALALLAEPSCAASHSLHHRTLHHAKRHRAHHSLHQSRQHVRKHHSRHHAVDSLSSIEKEDQQLLNVAHAVTVHLTHAARELVATLNGTKVADGALRGAKALPGNVSTKLKAQQLKLGDLLKHLKSNIAEFNKRESDQKKDSQVYAEKLKKRLEEDHRRLKDPNLSAFDHALLVNRTRTEESELKFWTRGRELQHDMFHSNLKLTHGLMSRVKTVIEAYKQVLTHGKLDSKLEKVLHETSSSMPKAFIQQEHKLEHAVSKMDKHLKVTASLLSHK